MTPTINNKNNDVNITNNTDSEEIEIEDENNTDIPLAEMRNNNYFRFLVYSYFEENLIFNPKIEYTKNNFDDINYYLYLSYDPEQIYDYDPNIDYLFYRVRNIRIQH